MIFGIGTDIVRVARMRRSLERFGDRFAEHILTESEMVDYKKVRDKARFLSKRFAAKEAAVKAFGTGFSQGIHLHEINVGHNERGKPLLQFSGRALEFVQEHHIVLSNISISDEAEYAVAFVTLETTT